MDYPQDPRTVGMPGGFGPRSEATPIARQHLVDVAARWPVNPHTPQDVAAQLQVARELFVHCLLVWEFGAVGAAWSLMAVESCLRWALGKDEKVRFVDLIASAHEQGLLTDDLAEKMGAGRHLRNMFSHPRSQPAFSLGMVAGVLETSHVVVHHVGEAIAAHRK